MQAGESAICLQSKELSMLSKRPLLPKPLSLPLRVIPSAVHARVLPKILNRVFVEELAEDELDFMQGRCVCIKISDAKVAFSLTLNDNRIIMAPAGMPADLTISGSVYDYMLLISGREDPDTLFFQRHLLMEGDTHLGVYLKNVLAAVDMQSLPLPGVLQPAMDRCLNIYERLA